MGGSCVPTTQPSRAVWVAGSTHAVEEEILLDAQRRLQRLHPHALLVLVPRHPPRFAGVAAWLGREGVPFVRVSQHIPCNADTAVLLVDSLGELLDFYAAGDVAFVGGTLVPIGGHNLLEPAALGLPILCGPHYSNSEDIAQLLMARGALEVVHDAAELAAAPGGPAGRRTGALTAWGTGACGARGEPRRAREAAAPRRSGAAGLSLGRLRDLGRGGRRGG